ncbi:MAG: hypothetical protein FJX75_07675 [Armatimonadetes bacterium]|nr:hypothetical protein [Armatimonadota bacterium]
MPALVRPGSLALTLALVLASRLAAAPVSLAGATALVIQPENSYNGYDFTIYAALLRRGFEVTQGQPDDLVDATKLQAFDLVVTDLKRSFTPEQVAGLKAYVTAGGATYGNWGGPMGCQPLLALSGVKNARSVYINELTLTESPLTTGLGEQRWVFPDFCGHVQLTEKGREMVAFDLLDGIEVAHDNEGRCLGSLREEGAGRCAVLGFCPSNYRFVTDDSRQAAAVLDNLLAWLLPRGSQRHASPQTIRVSLPREAKIASVSVDGRRLPDQEARAVGSLQTVAVPVAALAEGETMLVRVACELPPVKQHIGTWLHDPSACSFISFEPDAAADFLAALHVSVVQPLLRYEGGVINCLHGIPGDRPRERFTQYQGDLLADYVQACHARGIKVIGGLYLDWRRFEQHLNDAPPHVARNQPVPEKTLGQPVCPLDSGVWDHNLAIVRSLLDNYPDLDGVILDDNFEFDGDPCYCAACQARFAAHCEQQPGKPDPQAEADSRGAVWKAFWKEQKLGFCKRVHDLCAERGKPVGGWTAQRGPIAFRGVFDFAGDMVYVEPPCSVAPLWPQVGDFPVVTLLWGMNRKPEGMEGDFAEAIRAGSNTVGFWIQYARGEGVTDNPWSLSWSSPKGFALTPGSLTAIERAFAGAEQAWRDYYRENLVQGDPRFAVTRAELRPKGLTVEVKRLDQPAPNRIMGPVNLAALSPQE